MSTTDQKGKFREAHTSYLQERKSLIQLLLDSELDIETAAENGKRPLHNAVEASEVVILEEAEEMVHILLRAGANISAQNNNRETALHFTSEQRLEKII